MTFDIEWAPDVVIGRRFKRFLMQAVPPTIRAADPSDVDAIVAMHERCTARSLTFRYLSGTFRPSTAQLAQLIAPAEGCTLVAEDTGVIAMANLVGQGSSAEAAILVEDSWQGRGIGTAMMTQLFALAPQHGIDGVELHLDAANRAALRLIRRLQSHLGGEPTWSFDGPIITFSFRMRPQTPPGD
jgi:ribosomal protein S18 acetylase RimI-like enzyme